MRLRFFHLFLFLSILLFVFAKKHKSHSKKHDTKKHDKETPKEVKSNETEEVADEKHYNEYFSASFLDHKCDNKFKCLTTNGNPYCIPWDWVCDDFYNACLDDIDELYCIDGVPHFPDGVHTQPIPEHVLQRLNNGDDSSGKDKENTHPNRQDYFSAHRSCNVTHFACQGGEHKCIPRYQLCNKHPDCPDGSDEGGFCGACEVKNCDGDCQDNPILGPRCSCHDDQRLHSDGVTCVDQDECEIHNHVCDHFCVNTDPGFHCGCEEGFVLGADESECLLHNRTIGRIMTVVGSQIFSSPLTNRNPTQPSFDPAYDQTREVTRLDVGVDFEGLDYDSTNERLLISQGKVDFKSFGTIFSFRKNIKTCLVSGIQGLTDVAVDWTNGNVFYSFGSLYTKVGLGVCDPDGNFCTDIYDLPGSDRSTCGLTVHPRRGLLFWADEDNNGVWRIRSSGMDGTRVETEVGEKLRWVSTIVIDYVREHLYWGDFEDNLIQRYDLITRERKVIATSALGVHHPKNLAFFDHLLYWTDMSGFGTGGSREILSVDTHVEEIPGYNTHEMKTAGHIHALTIVHPQHKDRTISNPCKDNPCSHICVSRPVDSTRRSSTGNKNANDTTEYACLCPFGYEPSNEDYDTCDLADNYGDARHPRMCQRRMETLCHLRSPCLNGGSCTKLQNGDYTCKCVNGWGGLLCEVGKKDGDVESATPFVPNIPGSRGSGAHNLTWVAAVVVVGTILLVLGVLAGYYSRKRHPGLSSPMRMSPSLKTKNMLEKVPSVSFLRRRSAEECEGQAHFVRMEDGHSHLDLDKVDSFPNPLYNLGEPNADNSANARDEDSGPERPLLISFTPKQHKKSESPRNASTKSSSTVGSAEDSGLDEDRWSPTED